MSVINKKGFVENLGYLFLPTPNGFICTDPLDNEDGYFIECPSEKECVDEAYEYLRD